MELKPDIRLVIATLTGGGSERVCLRLANQWANEGRQVEILLVSRKGVYLQSLDTKVRVLSADVSRARYAFGWLWWQLARWPDVPTLLFGFDFGVGLGALKRLGLISAPLIYREGSCPLRNVAPRSHWKYRVFVGGVEGVIAQSRHALANLQGLGVRAGSMTVIWNPMPARPGSDGPGSDGHGFAAKGLRLVAAGRLSPEKGFIRLLKTVAGLREVNPGLTLTIAGEGPQRGELEQQIEALGLRGVVNLTGFVAKLDSLYHESDCFVLSSDYEGQPNALLEAVQCGTRVVAAGGEGVGELLQALGLEACWIPEADFEAGLASALKRAGALPDEQLSRARDCLHEMTEVRAVAQAYREFGEHLRC